jgi:hypothetical protein
MMNEAFNCVTELCKKYNIDESHGVRHSMEVLKFAEDIFCSEVQKNLYIKSQKNIIIVASIIHDMVDHKYVKDQQEAILYIKNKLKECLTKIELDTVINIITTMSYSKVQLNGYPDLGDYQLAYHIVREADLLASYDINRCIIYSMCNKDKSYTDAFDEAKVLLNIRLMKYRNDKLFVTDYGRIKSIELHVKYCSGIFSTGEDVDFTSCICHKDLCSECVEDRYWGGVGDCKNKYCRKFTCNCNRFNCKYCFRTTFCDVCGK